MPVIDELQFTAKSLAAKMARIGDIAKKVNADPNNKMDSAMFKVMTADMDDMLEQYTGIMQKIAAYNAKQNPRIEEDLQPDIVIFESTYYTAKAIAELILPSTEKLNQTITTPTNASGSHPAAVGISLPTLKLVEFAGDLRSWSNFYELYLATVHNNPQLSEIQKYMYLRSLLKGEALALISSLPITAKNYDVAWSVVKSRYNDTNLLTSSYLESLLHVSPVTRESSSLRSFATSLIENTGALENLGHDVNAWSVPVLFLLVKQLSPPLRERWEKIVVDFPLPTITQFIAFVGDEAKILEAAHAGGPSKKTGQPRTFSTSTPIKRQPGTSTFVVHTQNTPTKCVLCSDAHFIAKCPKFQDKLVMDRYHLAKEHRLCLNCLKHGHMMRKCPKQGSCKQCSSRHHHLLHIPSRASLPPIEEQQTAPAAQGAQATAVLVNTATPEPATKVYQMNTPPHAAVVLLATARAHVSDADGKYHQVKILIDSASQGTFITRACAERLRLPVQPASVPVFGMAQTTLGVAKGVVTCHFQRARDVELCVDALLVENIANCPSMSVQPIDWQHLCGLQLADVEYYRSQSVDILLGAEWFGTIVIGNLVVGPPGAPSAMETIWGYCLLGRVSSSTPHVDTFCMLSADTQLDQTLRKFWETEEPPASPISREEDRECEELYRTTVARTHSGRYVVELPFRLSAPQLRDSRQAALRRFQSLERRLSKHTGLRSHYNEFMKDYMDQGHMVRALNPVMSSETSYYIPHHCIFRDESPITKFRVVFDASMKTTSGAALNETLHVGPKLQADISELLIVFRLHAVVLVADIRQMYRNIRLSDKHFDFQRIFWRFQPEDPLEEFCLTTVTYGISASPFLAIRTLQQLVADEGSSLPAAAQAITSSTYMDDIVTSVPSISEAIALREELIELMSRAGFELRKWMSNEPEVMKGLRPEHCAVQSDALSFEDDTAFTKILGLVWNPHSDTFSYRTAFSDTIVTKRTILSDVARLYDPLGYIAPVTFYGKWLIQHLWQLGLDWDEPVPTETKEKWLQFRQELPQLSEVALPRNLGIDTATRLHLHGFADSSEKGYAGVVYLYAEQRDGTNQLSLLIAKSKVAPLKRVTLPRLELCAVVLTANLVHQLMKTLKNHCEINSTSVWTDSKVALSWVQSSPHKWQTYVANRVSQAQSFVPPHCYHHVPSALNPADCASRGLMPSDLRQHPLWLPGPDWLTHDSRPHAEAEECSADVQRVLRAEARVISLQTTIDAQETLLERIMAKASSLLFLKRVVAWCLRFAHNTRNKPKLSGSLSAIELSAALNMCIRLVQAQEFATDIRQLESGQQTTSRLRKLNPFIGNDGLLRVGGRLAHSKLVTARKHPILLPKAHHLTLLVIDHYHYMYLHPGVQTLLSIIQAQFWILSARDAIRHRISKCLTCYRTQPHSPQPIMADLPAARLNAVKPFAATGIDYGGPFEITLGKVRNAKRHKAYICLFVCFATKAVHLELASELTTDAFLAALRRFLARRGYVSDIYSDCGTNFVGAKRKLGEWYELVASRTHNEEMKRQLANRNITWHLNPPSAPHFGGLWEAGIKSTKMLLRKVIGSQLLTYEEFNTVLIQVEATLNSRPLTPCSSDPNDLQALTPGHFLLLEPPAALIEPETTSDSLTFHQRWKLLQHITTSFWKRWAAEYLSTLQQRAKWTKSGPNLHEGSLVLIKEDNLPPLQWRLGRIIRVCPGNDGVARVAEVTTISGVVTRPVVKLCPLPVN